MRSDAGMTQFTSHTIGEHRVFIQREKGEGEQ